MQGKRFILAGNKVFSQYADGSVAYGCNVNRELKRKINELDCCGNGRTQIVYDRERKIWVVNHNSNVVFDNPGNVLDDSKTVHGLPLDDYNSNRLQLAYGFESGDFSTKWIRDKSPEFLTKLLMREND